MTTPREQYEPYYTKAAQSWLGAQSELAAGRYDNAVALAYYACFQLAVATMTRDGVPYDRREGYSHGLAVAWVGQSMGDLGETALLDAMRTLYDERIVAQYRPASQTLESAGAVIRIARRILAVFEVK